MCLETERDEDDVESIAVDIRETEKPNLSGWSAKRRWRRVLLPTPDGPDMTSGRRKSGRGDMVCILFVE